VLWLIHNVRDTQPQTHLLLELQVLVLKVTDSVFLPLPEALLGLAVLLPGANSSAGSTIV
jgi:hypothetical protein